MHTSHRTECFASVLAALSLVAACGGDGEATVSVPGVDGEDVAAFCEQQVEARHVIDLGAWAVDDAVQASLLAIFQEVEIWPEEVALDVAMLVEVVTPGVKAQSLERMFADIGSRSDEFVAALDARDGWLADHCGWDVVPVAMDDYFYDADWDAVPAGYVGFALDNLGDDLHNMVLYRINDGMHEPLAELLQLPPQVWLPLLSFKVGSRVAGPMDNASMAFTYLEPGRYAMFSALPVGAVAGEDGPPQYTEGMYAEFTVGRTAAQPS